MEHEEKERIGRKNLGFFFNTKKKFRRFLLIWFILQVFEIKRKYQGTKVKSLLSIYLLCIPLSKLHSTFLTQFLHFSNGDNSIAVSFRGVIRCFESFDIGRRHQTMKMQRTVMLKAIHRSI